MNLLEHERLEPIGRGQHAVVSPVHHFSTDTILLADFSLPRRGDRCAELGTGCGLVSLLWCQRGAPQKVWALDLQEDACSQARRGAALNGFSQMEVLQYDLRRIPGAKPAGLPLPLELDLVACNPPYQPQGDGQQSPTPGKAAARHEETCSLGEVAAAAARLLRWGGRFCCCMKPQRLCDTFLTLREAGLEPKRLRMVQHRAENAPFLFLLEARRGGNPGLTALPTLLLEEAGALTAPMRAIYGDYKPPKEPGELEEQA